MTVTAVLEEIVVEYLKQNDDDFLLSMGELPSTPKRVAKTLRKYIPK